jgi:hypothetical protein
MYELTSFQDKFIKAVLSIYLRIKLNIGFKMDTEIILLIDIFIQENIFLNKQRFSILTIKIRYYGTNGGT